MQKLITELKTRAADARAVLQAALDRREQIQSDLSFLNRQTAMHKRGSSGNITPPKVSEERKALVEAEAEITKQIAERSKVSRELGQLVGNLENWIENLSSAPTPVTLPKVSGETLDGIRAEITRLKGEVKRIAALPADPGEMRDAVRAWVSEKAAAGRPSISTRKGLSIHFRDTANVEVTGMGSTLTGTAVDPVALQCWIDPEGIAAAIERDMGLSQPVKDAITATDRARLTRETADALLAAERREEALIRSMEAEGKSPMRRVNADPRAVLMLDIGSAGRRAA